MRLYPDLPAKARNIMTAEPAIIIISPMRDPCSSAIAARRSFVNTITANPPRENVNEPAAITDRSCITGVSCLSTSRTSSGIFAISVRSSAMSSFVDIRSSAMSILRGRPELGDVLLRGHPEFRDVVLRGRPMFGEVVLRGHVVFHHILDALQIVLHPRTEFRSFTHDFHHCLGLLRRMAGLFQFPCRCMGIE